ncbi:MAG: alpha-ketoglutarate-dependent dioxygenase AlkB [bacterium]|nr:alpha-ketoglutarate-dependent dioxygenase AlkB [bacterium]
MQEPNWERVKNGEMGYVKGFFTREQSQTYFSILMNTVAWEQKTIHMFGKPIASPRLTAWYGDAGVTYSYSGIRLSAPGWLPCLVEIKARIESFSGETFNSVLANLYRDGTDSMGWHSDDEAELGKNPVISSVSFGSPRDFALRHKQNRDVTPLTYILGDGDLLVMRGETQHYWKHQIPKTKQKICPRINLTFRRIVT